MSNIPEVRGRRLEISLGFFMEEMEAAISSETPVDIYQNVRRDIQKQQNVATHHR
jgi:hypothetical protein